MDFSLYSEEIREYDRRQDEYLSILDERAIPILEDMLKVAKKTDDPKLIGYVYHTLSFAEFFITGRYKKFNKYLKLAAKYIAESGDEAEMTHIYYLSALDAQNKGLYDISHRFFLESRSLAGKINLGLAVAIMNLNIAQVFMRIERFREAREYVQNSISVIRASKNHIYHYKNLTTLYMEDVLISIELGEANEAMQSMDTAEKHVSKHRELLTGATLLKYEITKLRLDLLRKGFDITADRIDELCETISVTPNVYSYMEDLFRLCRELIRNKECECVKTIIDTIGRKKPDDEATMALLQFTEINIAYCKAVGDKEGLEAAYKEQERVLEIQDKNQKEIYRYVIELAKFTSNIRRTRKIALSEHDKLNQIAKIDDLTHIPNRFGVTLHVDELFEKAYKAGTKLGIVFLDLDGLKFINDTQGHLAGDACLIDMGRILSKHMEDGEFFAARYGGDEFLLVYDNVTTKEIKSSIAALHKESDVKFSCGIINDTPKGKEKSWQYIELADKELYKEKKRKRSD